MQSAQFKSYGVTRRRSPGVAAQRRVLCVRLTLWEAAATLGAPNNTPLPVREGAGGGAKRWLLHSLPSRSVRWGGGLVAAPGV